MNDTSAGDEPLDDLEAAHAAASVLGMAADRPPPGGLRARVLVEAFGRRAPATAERPADPHGVTDAFRRTVHDLDELLGSLTADEARRPTVTGWSVAGVVGHLVAVDRHFGAVVGWWADDDDLVDEHDHVAMTLGSVRDSEERPFDEVREQWRSVAARIDARLDSLHARFEERVVLHGFDFSVRSVLLVRTFEMWTHCEDICRATGRPLMGLDADRLALMTDAAVRAIPVGMILADRPPLGRTVRIVLRGDGGGSWDQPLDMGASPGAPVATVVASAMDFCRVAAQRLAPDDLVHDVAGDQGAVGDLLVAVGVFAA